jgi:hypothetical protein
MQPVQPVRLKIDHGITGVSRRLPPQAELPDSAALPPAESTLPSQLALLLERPGIEEKKMAELRPELSDPSLLLPARFAEVLGQVLERLDVIAEEYPHAARPAGRADYLLRKVQGNLDLVHANLSALLKG